MIQVEKLDHAYGRGALRHEVLHQVSFEVRPAEVVILAGPSGSGKSTLLTLIGGLRSVQQGSLRVLGTELRGAEADSLTALRRNVGFVFQQHNLLASLTASENVMMAPILREGGTRRGARSGAREALAAVGLQDCAERLPRELSGGQKQRVAVARALAGGGQLILADEPTASLDATSGRDVAERIAALARESGRAALIVTHDERIFDLADRILRVEDGRVVDRGSQLELEE